ncbi:hypothetical protein FP568_17200 [Pandoraea pnomenusa]|uniref:hypothetical protein n=1 Tax=Pandoraea pnomenusa TaxID=93220 RepID=UPI001198A7B3|nr:hypothetical protein [Pandoraea pnomenusa]QDX22813.1 hypothetical protein FP568_17200 [Pandoraea pnomenusa]
MLEAVVAAVVDGGVDGSVGATVASGVNDGADASIGIDVAMGIVGVGDVPGDVDAVRRGEMMVGTRDGDGVAWARFSMRRRSTRTSGGAVPASASYAIAPARDMGMAKARNGMLHTSRESWVDRKPVTKPFGADGKCPDLKVSRESGRDNTASDDTRRGHYRARQGSTGHDRARQDQDTTDGYGATVDHRELGCALVSR